MKKTDSRPFEIKYFVFDSCQQFVRQTGPTSGQLITLYRDHEYFNYSFKSAEPGLLTLCADGRSYQPGTKEEWQMAYGFYLNFIKKELAQL